jgi:hypothetical protein
MRLVNNFASKSSELAFQDFQLFHLNQVLQGFLFNINKRMTSKFNFKNFIFIEFEIKVSKEQNHTRVASLSRWS